MRLASTTSLGNISTLYTTYFSGRYMDLTKLMNSLQSWRVAAFQKWKTFRHQRLFKYSKELQSTIFKISSFRSVVMSKISYSIYLANIARIILVVRAACGAPLHLSPLHEHSQVLLSIMKFIVVGCSQLALVYFCPQERVTANKNLPQRNLQNGKSGIKEL